MKRKALFAALTAALVVPSLAVPASADESTSGPEGPPTRVVVLTPADPSGEPPTLSADGAYTLTSASGKALGTRDRVVFPQPRPKPSAEDRLAGRDATDVADAAHADLAAPPDSSPGEGSPSRKDNGVDPVAEDSDFDSHAAQADEDELADPMLAAMAALGPGDYAVQDYETVDINDCMADAGTYGANAKARSHLFLCSGSTVTATAYSCWLGWFCQPVGWVTFTITTIGRAQNNEIAGPRSVSMISLMRDVIPGGSQPQLAMAFQIRVSMNCSAAPGLGSACENDFPSGLTMPMTEWAAYPGGIPFNLTAPSGDGIGEDLVSFYDFDTQVSLVGANWTTFGAGSFRCDYGRGMNTGTGCVFPGIQQFTRMSLTDPSHYQAAQHIWTALYNPSVTNPPGVNKNIPGSIESGMPLTRTVDQQINRANRRKAVGACRRYDSDYKNFRRTQGLECDEFPFASTLQGANSGGDFSVRSMPAAQNQAGGQALAAWYSTFRILDGDVFYVSVRE